MPQYLSSDKERELIETAAILMMKGKGLLSADESTGRRKNEIFYVIKY
jgi:fructose-bisphosphate aldolase class 1